jgi:tetratricopeptide (TPR) repeat protein
VKSRLPLTSFCIVFLFISHAIGQTYDVNGQGSSAPNNQSSSGSDTTQDKGGSGFGWGSSIEVARQARAAQDALKRNDYAAAVSFAEQAAKAAPQNAELWFLLGYADRLDNHYQQSIEAYNRGLKIQPNSIRGTAGLAQTYAKMGRDAEAEQLLKRVVEANPKDANSLQLAGELLLNSDPKQALDLLKRADALQASPHTDLLIAHTYERLGQSDEFTHYLNRARNRAPKDPEVLRAVAGEYRDHGQYDEAISALQAIPNKTTDVQSDLAYTYQLAGRQQ